MRLDDCYETKDLVHLLGISRQRIYAMRTNGQIPYRMLAGRVIYAKPIIHDMFGAKILDERNRLEAERNQGRLL